MTATGQDKSFTTEAGKVDIEKRQAQTFTGKTVNLNTPESRINSIVKNPDGSFTVKRWKTAKKQVLLEMTYDKDGFAVMPSKIDVYIPPAAVAKHGSPNHFKAANEELIKAMTADPTLGTRLGLTVAKIKSAMRDSPPGYTWHHHQTVGLMQLVPSTMHGKFGHTGGDSIWGDKI